MAYKVFTNGSPLPASDLNTYLMNQSVMVFANSTARSAALTSPTEGMTTYLEDTNALEVYNGASWVGVGGSVITTQGDLIIGNVSGVESRLAIGANNTVLTSNGTTASWAALSSPATSWSQLATGSLTGAATITISGFTSKNNYVIAIEGASSANAASNINIRFNGLTSNYSTQYADLIFASSYNSGNFEAFLDGGQIPLGKMSSDSGSRVRGFLYLSGGKSGSAKIYQNFGMARPSGGNSQTAQFGGGYHTNTDAITSFSILSSTGNFDDGTYYLYGAD